MASLFLSIVKQVNFSVEKNRDFGSMVDHEAIIFFMKFSGSLINIYICHHPKFGRDQGCLKNGLVYQCSPIVSIIVNNIVDNVVDTSSLLLSITWSITSSIRHQYYPQ
jgi:hypothetical protein